MLKKLWGRIRRGQGFLKTADAETVFTNIYERNLWEDDESASGPGSTLVQTRNLREQLPKLIKNYDVKTLFDAPCGDFNWMRHVLQEAEVTYIGGDIVGSLIEKNAEANAGPGVHFVQLDITQSDLPDADLMLCRDCLFHLSHKDTRAFFQNFVDSKIKLLLTTNHLITKRGTNRDITTGGFRTINLTSPPYNLPDDPHFRTPDFEPPEMPREMCLWDREQIRSALEKWPR